MAVSHAGVKRSFQEMHGYSSSTSTPNSSRDASLPKERQAQYTSVAHSEPQRLPATRAISFDVNASVVLVGIRGVGKSSLGVIAATALNRRLIEFDKAFLDATGTTTHAFRKLQGVSEYRQKHRDVFDLTLKTYGSDCVIICSFSDLEHDGVKLLQDFSKTHPVIHVTRDARGIQGHLQAWSEQRIEKLLCATGPILRSCANYSFFNVSESVTGSSEASRDGGLQRSWMKSANGPFLTLKGVERDFVELLQNITAHDRLSSHHFAYPLSQVPVETRDFTLCVVVDVDDVLESKIDLDELQVGADAVELQFSVGSFPSSSGALQTEAALLRAAEAYATLRRHTILPLVLTPTGGDALDSNGAHSAFLVDFCLRMVPEYCAVDLSVSDTHARGFILARGRTAMIATKDIRERPVDGWTDTQLTTHYNRAADLGFQLAKLTMPSASSADNSDIEVFRQKAKTIPLIAYETGLHGRTSMCSNKRLTPVRHPAPNNSKFEQKCNSAVLTSKQIFTALFATFVYEPMHFFIYGASVDYSLSPAMHNAAYEACGIPHRYFTHSSPNLEDFRRLAQDQHFGGAALVQPYKTEVLEFMASLSPEARAIGAVNTVVPVRELDESDNVPSEPVLLSQRNRSGPVKALYGQNTDWIGIRACLQHGLSPANTIRTHTTGLICGAGGQARSTVYAMLSLGVKTIFICNRTVERAVALADHYNRLIQSHAISELGAHSADGTSVKVIDSFGTAWPEDKYRHPSLIVSTVPTQDAAGSLTDFRLPEGWLRSPTGGVAIELAYRPMNTPIVSQMKAHAHQGWIFMDGFDILPEQAFAQFELFTGRRAPRKLMREEVIRRYHDEQSKLGGGPSLDPNPKST